MGVDYELFWLLDPKTLTPFIKAFSIKQKINQQTGDSERWQLGVYIRLAVASLFDKNNKYPEKPIFSEFEEKQEVSDEEKQEQAERARRFEIQSRFMKHANLLNSQRKGETHET